MGRRAQNSDVFSESGRAQGPPVLNPPRGQLPPQYLLAQLLLQHLFQFLCWHRVWQLSGITPIPVDKIVLLTDQGQSSAPSSTVIQNPAFGISVKGHMDALSPMERDAFNKGAQITPEELMEKIRGFDELHCQESQFRRCTSGVENFLKILDQYLKPLAICIGHSPEFSSLIVGGLKLIVDVRMSAPPPFQPRV